MRNFLHTVVAYFTKSQWQVLQTKLRSSIEINLTRVNFDKLFTCLPARRANDNSPARLDSCLNSNPAHTWYPLSSPRFAQCQMHLSYNLAAYWNIRITSLSSDILPIAQLFSLWFLIISFTSILWRCCIFAWWNSVRLTNRRTPHGV